ncbi:MAG: hypothetical protein P8O03_03925 [Ilumatobacter sp.]|nr:hypothetical protein [Ilumatobacter sp.]
MSVTASFQPDHIGALPGQAAALSLHLQNNTTAEQVVTLRVAGELAAQTVLQTETIYLDPNEHFEVPVIVDASVSLVAGPHNCVVEVSADNKTTSAAAIVQIDATAAWTARLGPEQSSSPTGGRHKVALDNLGNVPVTVEIATSTEADVVAEIAAPTVNIDGGKSANVELRITPHSRFWSGPPVEHPFSVSLVGSNDEQWSLDGLYTQGPRVQPWVVPALAGMLGALLFGTLAWFLLLRPAVEDIAREEAAELDAFQQDELDAAAKEASELPLGEPTDLRLTVQGNPGTTVTESFDFDQNGSRRVLSVTDVILQNPTGAVGRLELLRDGEVLLNQEMANFRDLDFHLVAPFQFDSGSTISLRVTCQTPGPGTTSCEASATTAGFVDEA